MPVAARRRPAAAVGHRGREPPAGPGGPLGPAQPDRPRGRHLHGQHARQLRHRLLHPGGHARAGRDPRRRPAARLGAVGGRHAGEDAGPDAEHHLRPPRGRRRAGGRLPAQRGRPSSPRRWPCSPDRAVPATPSDRGDPVRALQLKAFQSDPELVELPEPEPGPGQVVIKVGGAGACHSDLHVMHEFQEGMAPWGPPFVIGHENAGWVHSLGSGVRGVETGAAGGGVRAARLRQVQAVRRRRREPLPARHGRPARRRLRRRRRHGRVHARHRPAAARPDRRPRPGRRRAAHRRRARPRTARSSGSSPS